MEVICPRCGHRWWDGGGEEEKIYQCPRCGEIFVMQEKRKVIPLFLFL